MDCIALLPADCPEEVLSALLGEAEGRGWRHDVSRGEEQTVVLVSGPGDTHELERLLAGRVDADVLSIRSGRRYRRLRTRRRAMHGLVGGLAFLVLFALALPVLGFLRPPANVLATPDVVRAAGANEMPANSDRLVRFRNKRILLVHLGAQRFFALDSTCTYMDLCQLEWSEERMIVECPCHGDAWDVYGNVIHGPASLPLRSYRVERFADSLFVRVGG